MAIGDDAMAGQGVDADRMARAKLRVLGCGMAVQSSDLQGLCDE